MKSSLFVLVFGVFACGSLAQLDDEGWQELPRQDGKTPRPHQSHQDLPSPWGRNSRDHWGNDNPRRRDNPRKVDIFLEDSRGTRDLKELEKCLWIADPLLREPRFIVPVNEREITQVCTQWSQFKQCLDTYTDRHMTTERKTQFDRAIQPSMDNIDKLCERDPEYEQDYLRHAPCLQKIATDTMFCGNHFQYLADLVRGTWATDAQLCSYYTTFRDCTVTKARQECKIPECSHAFFMFDRALTFLLQKCKPNTSDCPTTPPPVLPPRPQPQEDFPEHPHSLDTPDSGSIDDSFPKFNEVNTFPPAPFTTEDPFFFRNKTSFTWTTPTPRSTTSQAWRMPNNNLDGGPESQQFRGESGSPGLSVSGLALGLLVGAVLWL